ncbi:MAG: polysaccharide biosynthesis C-terminal domain-containing protein [Betaproteobacteria bacterium]|nr:polysaccharide biosynthesis C-terminal domain-containing protein [Betaproteobacteria bacterium]
MAFLYALATALAFQKVVLPHMPALHGAHGLLKNDALFFHERAVELAARIGEGGWSELGLLSFGGLSGNIKLLAAVYALFGIDPAWFLPITCALHALAAVLLYRLGALLWPGRTGQLGGLIAAILFTLSPTSLQWYGQNHKDSFAIAGTLLIVSGWIRSLVPDWSSIRQLARSALMTLAGALLVLFVRSYLLQILLLGMVVGTLAAWVVGALRARVEEGDALSIPRALLPVVIVAATFVASPKHEVVELVLAVEDITAPDSTPWAWQSTGGIPRSIDHALQKLSTSRAHFASSGHAAGSLVDGGRLPANAFDALAYMPRALAIGLFAPFPGSWVENPTAVRLIGAFETLVWYGFFPGIALFVLRRPSVKLFACLGFAGVSLTIMGYAEPVVGTLYRLRFGIWTLLLLTGAAGWAHLALRVLDRLDGKREGASGHGSTGSPGPRSVLSRVAADGSVVMLLWGLTLIGFLLRDLVLIGSAGLGTATGAFFAAAMVPMFFFAFLSAPMSDAMTGSYLHASTEVRRGIVRSILGWSALLFASVGGCLFVLAEQVMGWVLSGADADTVAESAGMLRWNLPVFVFSGWTVVGAAVLNAGRRSRVVAVAQFCVPVVTIATFLALESRLGVKAIIFGMLGGMAANTLIVTLAAARSGVALLPSLALKGLPVRVIGRRYVALGFAALFTAAIVPLNFGFAGALGSSEVPIWAFASKLVQVFTTTVGFAIGAVALPHLATLAASHSRAQLRDDTWFLLVIGTWLWSVRPAGRFLAEPVALALLVGGNVTAPDALQLADVLKIGALQLPFVVTSTILIKTAAVAGAAWRATLSAAAGLGVNAVANLLLVPDGGVHGLALASTAGAAMTAVTLLLLARRRADLAYREVGLMCAAWLGVACLGAAVGGDNVVLALVSVTALIVLVRLHWTTILERTRVVS